LANGVAATSVRNLLADISDDWFADPWGYPELRAGAGLAARGGFPATPPAQMLIPKTPAAAWAASRGSGSDDALGTPGPGRMRPAAFLLPVDRLRYQAAVDALAPSLRPARRAPSFGWRAHRRPPRPGRYRGQRSEWAECLRLLRAHADRFGHLVFLDIADFYGSIRRDLLVRAVEPARSPRTADLDPLFEAFFSPRLAYPGLPQHHQPSAVLANAYVDAALAGLEVPAGRAAVVRWMDDLWLFGGTAAAVERVRGQVTARLAAWQLQLNEGKTRVYQGLEVRADVEGTTVRTPDRYQASRIPADCADADEEWRRIERYADPRAADSLRARLLYAHPCTDRADPAAHVEIAARLAATIVEADTLARFQPAAWWLARRDPPVARELLSGKLPEITDPFIARACALAARDAGAEPGGSVPGQGVADPAQAAYEYAPVAPVGHGLA